MLRFFFLSLIVAVLISCAPDSSDKAHPVITTYSNAYNAKDLAAMKSLMHPDIEWISVNGNEIEVAISGKKALSEAIKSFFEDPNMARGTHKGWSLNGDHVAVTETAHWTDKNGQARMQSALTVYQFENNLIRRVYYYPARQP